MSKVDNYKCVSHIKGQSLVVLPFSCYDTMQKKIIVWLNRPSMNIYQSINLDI